MRENSYGRNDEIELRLSDLFWSVMRHWRGIVITMLVCGVLLGAFGLFREYRSYTDPEAKAKAEEDYRASVEKYERSKETYETKVENLRTWISRLDYYKQNSIMLLMDPYDIYRTTVTYFVDSDYEIMPGVMFQNPNYTEALVNSYEAAVSRIDFDELIDLPNGADLTTQHTVNKYATKTVYAIEADVANGLMTITVISDTQKRGDKIMTEIRRVMTENEQMLNQVVGEHKLSVVSEGSERTLDLDLANLQTAFTNDYESNSTELDKAEESLKNLKEPTQTVPSKTSVITKGIKFGILGLVAGLFAAAVLLIFDFFNKDKVVSISGLQTRFGLPVLGVIRGDEKKLKKIDKMVAEKLGAEGWPEAEEAASYTASAIRLRLKEDLPVLFVGTAGQEKLEKICGMVSAKLPEVKTRVGGNVNRSAEAMEALRQKTAVICVEEWQNSVNEEITQEMDALRASGNPVVGFIVIR